MDQKRKPVGKTQKLLSILVHKNGQDFFCKCLAGLRVAGWRRHTIVIFVK